MPTKTTDLFEVEHIEYVADRSVDEVASALEEATGTLSGPSSLSKARPLHATVAYPRCLNPAGQ
jgi:hypothetical protein